MRNVATYVDIVTPARTAKEIRFILKALRLKKGARILDLTCGQDRHSVAFAQHGFRVTGFDYSRHLLALARQEASAQNVAVRFVRGDMRKLSFAGEFDAVINWFTAFGYFADDADDARVVRGVARALIPGGWFLLDTTNGLFPFLNSTPRSKRWKLSNGLAVTIRHELDPVTMRWMMTRTWRERGRRSSWSRVRLFVFPELKRLLETNGLTPVRLWGDYASNPFTADSHRLIVLARKRR